MADYATLNLRLKNNQFNRGVDQSMGKLGKMGTMVKAAGTAIAGAFVVKKLISFGMESVRLFNKQEDAVKSLSAALDIGGQKMSRLTPIFENYASALQKQTIYGDEVILAQMAYGKNLGITTDKLKAATKAAIGLAAKFNLDLKTSMMLVGRASQGQTQMLTRYGITLDDTLGPQEKFNELLKIGADNFGLAEAQTQTTAGRLKQLSNTWGDLKELIGGSVVEFYNLNGVLEGIKNTIEKIQGTTDAKNKSLELDKKLEEWNKAHPFNKGKNAENAKEIKKAVKVDPKEIQQQKQVAQIQKSMQNMAFEQELKKLKVKEQVVKLQQKEHDLIKASLNASDSVEAARLRQEALRTKYRWQNLQEKSNQPKETPAWQKTQNAKIESTLTDAVEKGSMEALRLSSTQVTRDDKLLKKNEETAKNTKESAKELKKISKSLSNGAGLQTVDAFA